jgi:hypothetical protein
MPTLAQKYENDKQDINNLTAIDIAYDDASSFADASASNAAKKSALSKIISAYSPCQGRLTLQTGNPFSVDNQTAKTSLYFTPFRGNNIALYDGTRWILSTFSELTLSLSGYTANKNYDIWVYSNSGTPTLDSTVWTNDTTRATSLAFQNGVYVKSGTATRRYVGTIRITGTTGQCEDSFSYRYVWNMYNRLRRVGFTYNTNVSWTYGTGAWRECNGGTGQVRFNWVAGEPIDVYSTLNDWFSTPGGGGYGGVCFDATTTASFDFLSYGGGLAQGFHNPSVRSLFSAGYHYGTQVEWCNATGTHYGNGSATSNAYHSMFTLEM